MTQEDIIYLSAYERNFNTAINSNYSRNVVSSALERMKEIYERHTGEQYRLCTHCSSSVLSFLKVVGKLYYKEVQKGNEPQLTVNELEKTVTKKENKKIKTKK